MGSTEWRRVGDLVTLQRGTTYDGSLVGAPGPALLGLGSIKPGGGFRASDFKTFGGECPPKLLVRPGQVYVALKGATKDGSMVGSVARLPSDMAPGRLTQDTARLDFVDPIPEVISHVYWTLRTPQYRQYCGDRITGSAAASFSRDDFLMYPIPPVTAVSRQLVELLEAVEAKLDLNRKMTLALARSQFALFLSWYEGLSESSRPLGQLIDLKRGISYSGRDLGEQGIPMITLGAFRRDGLFEPEGIRGYVGDFKEEDLVAAGDVVVANTDITQQREVLGRPLMVPPLGPKIVITHHVSRLAPLTDVPGLGFFLVGVLSRREFRERAAGFATGTTVLALPKDAILDFKVTYPGHDAVSAFAQQLIPFHSRELAIREESPTLQALLRILLHKLGQPLQHSSYLDEARSR